MQLRLLPFLCLYATVHIQFIAAFPNHGTANQIVHNPNANQGQTTKSNGVFVPVRTTQKPLNSEWKPRTLCTAKLWKYNSKSRNYTDYGEIIIRIIKNSNTAQLVLESISGSWKTIRIPDIKSALFRIRENEIDVDLNKKLYGGFQFFDSNIASTCYQTMLRVQGENQQPSQIPAHVQNTELPDAAQQLHNQDVSSYPETDSLVKVHTETTNNESEKQQYPIDSTSSPHYIMSVSATVHTNSAGHNEWIHQGSSMIRLKKNQHDNIIKLSGIMVNNIETIMNAEDIRNFTQRPSPDDTHFEFEYENLSYLLGLNDKITADNFARAMHDAFETNTSTPTESEEHNSVNGTASDDQQNVGLSSSNPSQQNSTFESSPHRRYICTKFTENYDCQIQGVHLKHGETYDFGLAHENHNQNITFWNSDLQYLPKSLIDAFPNMKLLNLNHLQIEDIEKNSFDTAGNLEELYLEGNRLTNFPREVLSGAYKLKKLILSDNNIDTLQYGFRDNNDLSYLFVDRNKIIQLPTFDNIAQLEKFNASHNELEKISNNQFVKQTLIKNIDLSYNRLSSLDLKLSTSKLKIVDVRNNRLNYLNVPLVMETLFSENNLLSEFKIGGRCDLKILTLNNNTFKSQPDLRSCNLLDVLDLSFNELEIFKFSQLSGSLRYLSLSHNHLFEILLPVSNYHLIYLDLSHNKLTYLQSLQSFTFLDMLKLNGNKLITIGNGHIPSSLKSIFAANNDWACNDVPKFATSVKDKTSFCGKGFEKEQGMCCKQSGDPFRDKVNANVRHVYFHEKSNREKQTEKCKRKTGSNQSNDIENIRQAATVVDNERAAIFRDMEKVNTRKAVHTNNLQSQNDIKLQSKTFKQDMASAIEKQRKIHRVTNEGLISDTEKLKRVINFIKERNNFNKDLKARREGETKNAEEIFDQKKQEKENLSTENGKQTEAITAIKKQERDKKKNMEILQKNVNRNAPAIHGKTGKL